MSLYPRAKNKIKELSVIQPIRKPLMHIDNMIGRAIGHDPEFVVVGTGRSGTVYISKLMADLGVPTRHEYFFGPEGYNKRVGVQGEVSWLAVPFLPDFKGKIIHQTRHPVKTINAFVSVRAVDPGRMHNKYIRFIDRHFEMTGDLLTDSMRFYIEWNRKAAKHAHMHFQIEKIAEAVPDIMQLIQKPCPEDYKDIISSTQRLNAKSKPLVTYEDLPKGALLDELAAASEEYGYKIDQ